MNEEFILALIEKFNAGAAVSLKVTVGDASVQLKKAEAYAAAAPVMLPSVQNALAVHAAEVSAAAAPAQQAEEQAADCIRSPIVATFYRSPSPDAPAYAEEGAKIEKGQPLCILEAMKMLNNLEAEFPCIIEKVLVANGDLVEYNQPLFQVRKI